MGSVMFNSVPFKRFALARTSIVKNTNRNAGRVGIVVPRRHNSYMTESNFWNVGISSLNGFWLHLTDENVRDEFQTFVDQKFINQDVLTQNMSGRIQMFALLHGLMNPLLRKYQFDTAEFVNAVGPALQIYHETLLQLMTEATAISDVKATTAEQKEEIIKQRIEDSANDEDNDDDLIEKRNSWLIEAESDPKSLAGRFIKMVTEGNLNEQYHNAQMIKLFSLMGIPAPMNYVAGSCAVEFVSLLNIKAIEMDDILHEQSEHPEFAASSDATLPVLARIQVLYKLSRQFQKRHKNKSSSTKQINSSPTSSTESYKSINTDVTPPSSLDFTSTSNSATVSDNDSDAVMKAADTESEKRKEDLHHEKVNDSSPTDDNDTTTANSSSSNKNGHNPEIYSETRLGVATFEGWLCGGGNTGGGNPSTRSINHQDLSNQRTTSQLRWKVASAKESNHFW